MVNNVRVLGLRGVFCGSLRHFCRALVQTMMARPDPALKHALDEDRRAERRAFEAQIDPAFLTLAQLGAGALVTSADVPFINWREKIVALAARHRVPTVYPYREYVLHGGLMSYGPSLSDINRKTPRGSSADR